MKTQDKLLDALVYLAFAEHTEFTDPMNSMTLYLSAYTMFRSLRCVSGSIVAGEGYVSTAKRVEAHQVVDRQAGKMTETERGELSMKRRKQEKKNALLRMQWFEQRHASVKKEQRMMKS